MENDRNKNSTEPGQRKWDKAGPDNATGRSGGGEGEAYTEGKEAKPRDSETTSGETRAKDTHTNTSKDTTENERRFGGSHTAGTKIDPEESSEWKGGTPSQGPTTGGMGSAGGGHDAKDGDETDVWGDRDKKK